MFKLSLELGNVTNTLKLRFSIIINTNDNNKVLTKYSIDGNDFLKLTLHPFITLDIRGKKETYHKNDIVNINRFNLYKFLSMIKEARNHFDVGNLYGLIGDRLVVNKDESPKYESAIKVDIDKVIEYKYIAIDVGETSHDYREAIYLFINNYDHGCILTIDALEYLIYVLEHIDMNVLSIQLYELYIKVLEHPELLNGMIINKTLEEVKEDITDHDLSIPQLKEPNTIPDI